MLGFWKKFDVFILAHDLAPAVYVRCYDNSSAAIAVLIGPLRCVHLRAAIKTFEISTWPQLTHNCVDDLSFCYDEILMAMMLTMFLLPAGQCWQTWCRWWKRIVDKNTKVCRYFNFNFNFNFSGSEMISSTIHAWSKLTGPDLPSARYVSCFRPRSSFNDLMVQSKARFACIKRW